MKTYAVEIRYTAFSNYIIEAKDEKDAEDQAWAEVNADLDYASNYGDWELMSIEERELA